MAARRLAGVIGALALTMSCTASHPAIDASFNPVWPSGQPAPASGLLALALDPRGSNDSQVITGIATLTFPAPEGGLSLSLSSNDPAVTVPASLFVPQGASRVPFSIRTRSFAGDRQVTITGSAGGRSVSAALDVRAMRPTSVSWHND